MINSIKLPIIGNYIRTVNNLVGKFGFQEGMRKLSSKYLAKYSISFASPETERILETKSAVVAANHPYEIETIALMASLPVRHGINLIINSEFMGLCQALDRYLIPVYIKHHYHNTKSPVYRKLSGILIGKINPSPKLSPEEEHENNINSIKAASEKINRGEIVVIYPERHGINGKWYPGIGHLIKSVMKKAYYIQAYVYGTSSWDYIRLIPLVNRLMPEIKIYFSEPVPVSSLHKLELPALMAKLENNYHLWKDSINNRVPEIR